MLIKDYTKVTPENLNFYDEIFNWKKSTGKRIIKTPQGGVKMLPRKSKLGSLSRSLKNLRIHRNTASEAMDAVLPIRYEKLETRSILKEKSASGFH